MHWRNPNLYEVVTRVHVHQGLYTVLANFLLRFVLLTLYLLSYLLYLFLTAGALINCISIPSVPAVHRFTIIIPLTLTLLFALL